MPISNVPRSTTLYPIRWIENLLISLALNPETTRFHHDYMTVRWAVRVKPGLSPRRVHRAFDQLVARHDPLRLRFVETIKGWKAEVLPRHPIGLIVEEHGPASPQEQQAIVADRIRRPLTALSPALFEMYLLKFAQSGDVLMLRANHAIIDAYSVAILVEELLKNLLNIPVGKAPMTYSRFVAFQQEKARKHATEGTRYWQQMLLPPPQELNIGRAAKGLGPMIGSAVQQPIHCGTILREADSARVTALSHATGASPFTILQTAYADTLCAMANQDTVLISSIFGRNDASLASYVGPSIEVAPIRHHQEGKGQLHAINRMVKKLSDIQRFLPFDGLHTDGPILQTYQNKAVSFDRFWITQPLPSGRLKSSTFGKLFANAMRGPLVLGPVSLEQVIIPSLCPSDAELDFTINSSEQGLTADLFANAAGYTLEDLETLADGIRTRLAQD
ncbi:MAG: condensation domain-containing protein [Sulfitobacter sp.]